MSVFQIFKGLYREAQSLDSLASQPGIKSEVKDKVRASAERIRKLANELEDQPFDIITAEPYRFETVSCGQEQSCGMCGSQDTQS